MLMRAEASFSVLFFFFFSFLLFDHFTITQHSSTTSSHQSLPVLVSVSLFLFFDPTYKRDEGVFLFVCLTYFT